MYPPLASRSTQATLLTIPSPKATHFPLFLDVLHVEVRHFDFLHVVRRGKHRRRRQVGGQAHRCAAGDGFSEKTTTITGRVVSHRGALLRE